MVQIFFKRKSEQAETTFKTFNMGFCLNVYGPVVQSGMNDDLHEGRQCSRRLRTQAKTERGGSRGSESRPVHHKRTRYVKIFQDVLEIKKERVYGINAEGHRHNGKEPFSLFSPCLTIIFPLKNRGRGLGVRV